MLYCAASLKIIIKLANKNIIAFIDTGFKINIINEREINSRDLIIIREFYIKIININRGSAIIINIVENIIININSVGVLKIFILIENLSCPLILGIPFNIKI